jgi:type IV pilus assembly protein PilQ
VPLFSRQLIPSLLIGAALAPPLLAAPQSIPQTPAPAAAAAATPQGGSLALTIRRSSGALEVVVQGTGPGPVLQQRNAGGSWQGQLTIPQPNGLRYGPQRISVPEAGLQSVSISGSGSSYALEVTPLPGVPLARPVVSADGLNLVISFPAAPQATQQTARLDLRQPGSVPQAAVAPPLQPRAVAPPLGDMAVGSMVLRNQSYINLSGPPVTLTLRNAPARDALMAIAQIGGYGFVYVDPEPASGSGGGSGTGANAAQALSLRPVTISFRNESFSKALNSVLLAAGLQARREGSMILAGPNVLAKGFGPQVSKVYRLNQASAGSAADYLASLGASITKVTVITNAVTQGMPQANEIAGGAATQQTQTQRITTTETYGGGAGPLKGLLGTTDSRLQTITLIGDSQLVAVAENYLRQIDLRQRQVALSVRILDVTLDNDAAISNSFAFRYGNNFIVSDRGQLIGAFGSYLPPNASGFDALSGGVSPIKPAYVSSSSTAILPLSPPAPVNPSQAYNPNNFYDLVKAVITSASAKTLASPTLFLSDNPEQNVRSASVSAPSTTQSSGSGGFNINSVTSPGSAVGRNFANEAFVVVGAQEITSYTVNQGSNGAPNTCQPVFQTAGLTLGARVKRIDDNGFVTFNLSPSITALTGANVKVEGCGEVKTIAVRALDTGDVRVRDGQTLILTGVISDQDIQAVRKWPILGDIPFVGQFFRDSSNNRKKRELVIMVTPRIVDDQQGGTYGYGYQPATADAQRFMAN